MQISNEFGQYFFRLPLKKSAKIVDGDAFETDWENVVSKNKLSFILRNPPCIGSKIMKQNQRDQIVKEFDNIDGSGVLDYVTAWYIKAAKYIQDTNTKVAFVSTNFIDQNKKAFFGGKCLINTKSKFILLTKLLNGATKQKEMQPFIV